MSKIEWTDITWNPVTGCSKISPGCKNCYAERMAKRLAGRCGYDREHPFAVKAHKERWADPQHWRKPRKVFVCSMGDLFHADVSIVWLDVILCLMLHHWQHTFILLTKRPERMAAYFNGLRHNTPGTYNRVMKQFLYPKVHHRFLAYRRGEPWHNIWLGVTAENQDQLKKRLSDLMKIESAVRLVSIEPMLEEMSLRWGTWIDYPEGKGASQYDALKQLDWVICGAETGPGARPMDPNWARKLRDQCAAAGVPFFMKKLSNNQPLPQDLQVRQFPGCDQQSAVSRLKEI